MKRATLLLLAGLTVASHAIADGEDQRRVAAETLFSEGRRLMETSDFEHACPKLRDSLELDPGLGTLLNLAVCYEKLGKTASAWTRYKDAVSNARAQGDADRERLASERIAALEPVLAKLRLRIEETAGLVIECDGSAIPRTLWDLDIPMDPGKHTFVGRAEGRARWEQTLVVAEGQRASIDVPALTRIAPPPVAKQTPRTEPNRWRAPLAWSFLGTGMAGVALGAIASGVAVASYDQAKQYCQMDVCMQRGLDLRGSAFTWADVGTVSFIASGALLAGGVLLWSIVPRQRLISGVGTLALSF